MSNQNKARLLLRAGLAFAFLYAAISGIRNPQDWVGFIPAQYTFFLTPSQALLVLEIAQIVLAVWLLWGKRLATASVVASLFFAGLLFFNWNLLPILFRDVALLASALALFFLARE